MIDITHIIPFPVMQTINTIEQLRAVLQQDRPHKIIGLVPTMGALHKGHISLVEAAKAVCDIVVVSIFVNPTQFNNPEDLEKYPKTLDEDSKMLKAANVDYLFAPTANEIYPDQHIIGFSSGYLDTIMEGATRPGHFSGVVQVVSKLFNIVQPSKAFFGQKDTQQLTLIKRLTSELCFNIEIIGCPIIREESGLAMSSRNRRLSLEEKSVSTCLYTALLNIKKEIMDGQAVISAIKNAENYIQTYKSTKIEYIEVVDAKYLNPISDKTTQYAICIACYVGEIRLIDNMVFEKI